MGCDIHCYIQYKEKNQTSDYWFSFGGQFNPGRNYTMFGILANVREHDLPKYYDPKGLPDHKLSWSIEEDLYLHITEDGQGDNEATLENALQWRRPIINDMDGKPYKVEHPDWHSHSWLTTDELKKAYSWYKKETGWKVGLEYRVLLSIMKALENKGKNDVELVFWFDN
jgi:hypothetical protein